MGVVVNVTRLRETREETTEMSEDTRERLRSAIAEYCSLIERLFVPGAKVTVLVRNPRVPGDADVLVTNDDDESILAAIQRRTTVQWFGVWAMRDGYEGHWHQTRDAHPEPLQTTRTEATRVCAALNEFAQERTDSLGWRYEVRPYPSST